MDLETKLYGSFIPYTTTVFISSFILFYYGFIHLIFETQWLSRYIVKEAFLSTILAKYFLLIDVAGIVIIFRPKNIINSYLTTYRKFANCIIISTFVCIFSLIIVALFFNPSEEFSNDLKIAIKSHGQVGKLKLDYFQSDNKCCGFDSYNDYKDATNIQLRLPKSCCSKLTIHNKCIKENAYKIGCYSIYLYELKRFKRFIFIMIGILLLVHLETIFAYFYVLKRSVNQFNNF